MADTEATKGRPTTYTPELAAKVCMMLADGFTLREACKPDDMPPESTVRRWVVDDREGFAAQYTRAREIGYHSMADELLEISDDGQNDWMLRNHGDNDPGWVANGENLQRSRLRVDTRKWLLSKALPKVYGDKTTQVHEGGDKPITIAKIERTIVDPKHSNS
jgi:hypothetical protein